LHLPGFKLSYQTEKLQSMLVGKYLDQILL
jgi:hypothetical protein